MYLKKLSTLSAGLLLLTSYNRAQKATITFSVKAPVQYETQHVNLSYGFDKSKSGNAINFGFSGSANMFVTDRISIGVGLGYFRQRFGITRPYDWVRLNPTSIPTAVTLGVSSYDYHLLVFPFTGSLFVGSSKRPVSFNLEYAPGFAVWSSYNSESAERFGYKHHHSTVRFFSHQVNLSVDFYLLDWRTRTISIGPSIRVLHGFREDEILYDDPNYVDVRAFDAFGINLKYHFRLYHPKLP